MKKYTDQIERLEKERKQLKDNYDYDNPRSIEGELYFTLNSLPMDNCPQRQTG